MIVCRSDQANKCFSSSVQLHDSLVKAWASWGDYLDQLFANEKYVTITVYQMRVDFVVNY